MRFPKNLWCLFKPASSLIYSGDKIIYPEFSQDMHHEVELVLLVGRTIKNADKQTSEDAILAYGVGLDMTLRDVQNQLKQKGHPWTIAKCFDTSAVISDFILKTDYQLKLDEEIFLKVNGDFRQKDSLGKMMFKPAELVEYVSSLMTLEEGDLIFTGTPKGVSKVNKGDKLEAGINGIVNLSCSVS